MSRREQKSWSKIPMGLAMKNYCAVEGQQQFNQLIDRELVADMSSYETVASQ
jgi:hypothetical protein